VQMRPLGLRFHRPAKGHRGGKEGGKGEMGEWGGVRGQREGGMRNRSVPPEGGRPLPPLCPTKTQEAAAPTPSSTQEAAANEQERAARSHSGSLPSYLPLLPLSQEGPASGERRKSSGALCPLICRFSHYQDTITAETTRRTQNKF
jgi:hypothetical protein